MAKNSSTACGKKVKKESVIKIELSERNFCELDEKGFAVVKGSNGKLIVDK